MIPKVIHYCWFGRKEKPQSVIDCIDSWKKNNPNYEIKEWNEQNFAYNEIPFSREAYRLGRYAFVSDVARIMVLFSEGGIYLDTDVVVVKSFDKLLVHKSFMSLEGLFRLSTAVIGAEPGGGWMDAFLSFYKNQHFILKDGSLLTTPNTVLLSKFLTDNYNLKKDELSILPNEVLCGRNIVDYSYSTNDETIAIHNFMGSWKRKRTNKIFNYLVRGLKLKV